VPTEDLSEEVAVLHQERWVTSRRKSQSVGNNNKQRFRITKQYIQDLQITFGMCYRREHVTQIC
jgi:hypothetical protein